MPLKFRVGVALEGGIQKQVAFCPLQLVSRELSHCRHNDYTSSSELLRGPCLSLEGCVKNMTMSHVSIDLGKEKGDRGWPQEEGLDKEFLKMPAS